MVKHSIYQFSRKLLQKSVFPYFKNYLLKRDTLAPLSINLDLTSACSYKCPYCIDKRVLNTGKMLDFECIKKLLEDWRRNGLKSVIVIGGGEPTLHPKFEEIIKFIKELSLQVGIVSNGTRLEKIKNICRFLRKNDWVRFSIDAGKNSTFQKLHRPRIKITLEDILRGVREMRKICPKLQIGYSFLVIGDGDYLNNIKEISSAAKSAKESGFSYFSLKPIITPDSSRKTEISKKNLEEIKAQIKKAKKLESKNFKVVESVNLLLFHDKDLKKLTQKQPRTCHIQFFRTIINPMGIFTCSSWRGFENLKIADKYDSRFVEKRKKIAKSFNANETCKEIHCLYAPLNCWIEDLISNPSKIQKLKSIDDFGDYFL